jgi:integrase
LWSERPENGGRHPTAIHLQGFLERLFQFAKASKYYDRQNPAEWRNHLEHVLPASKDVHKVEHQPSLPYREVGRFLQAVRAYEDKIGWGRRRVGGHPTVALYLEFVVLTGVRISEARLATWDEIDEKKSRLDRPERTPQGRPYHQQAAPRADHQADV